MKIVFVLLVAAATFGLCFLVDKGFTKLFRSQSQHYSGLSVRLSKKYGAVGLILFVIGVAAVFSGLRYTLILTIGGAIVALMGVALVVYYMTFGIFYDADSFVYTSFGKKSVTYRYSQIRAQQLYILQGGGILVELHMMDGNTIQVQLQLENAAKFLDTAFAGWCTQRSIDPAGCDFHDTDNSCWFPAVQTEEV